MKNLYFLLFGIIFFASCNSGYKVKIKLDNIPAMDYTFEKINPTQNEVISEGKVAENGTIILSGTNKEPELYILKLQQGNKLVLVLDNNDNVSISGDWTRFSDYKVEGSEGTQQIKTLLVQLREFIRDANTMDKIASNLKDSPKKDSLIGAIQKEIKGKNKIFTDYVKAFADSTKYAPCAIFAANFLNRDVEYTFLNTFYSNLTTRFNSSSFAKENANYGLQELQKITPPTGTDVATKTETKTNLKKSNYVRPANAVLAPAINIQTPDGSQIQLSDFKGKFVLLDFWASWCGPCRQENPNVVKAYQLFKNKNFDVFGVSLDDDADAWKQAIEKDQLTWKHGSDLKKWSSIPARDYGVQGIPMNYLIDPDGYIIASRLRGEDLIKKLEEVID